MNKISITANVVLLFTLIAAILIFMTIYSKIESKDIEINKLENQIKSLEKINNDNKLTTKEEKIKKLILTLQPRLDPELAEKFSIPIVKYSKEYGFPPELITSLINRESSFNSVAVSSANCVGLMQINPKAHKKLLEEKNISYYQISHIDNNIELGCIILKEYFEKHGGDIRKTLTNYVGGKHEKYINDILESFTLSQINLSLPKMTEK